MAEQRLKTSIAILGCGEVGATLAYTLLQNPICSEVILVDPKKELLEAQVRDLGDATYGGRAATRIRAGMHQEAGQADIVVVTAGAKQKPGKSILLRMDISIPVRNLDTYYGLKVGGRAATMLSGRKHRIPNPFLSRASTVTGERLAELSSSLLQTEVSS